MSLSSSQLLTQGKKARKNPGLNGNQTHDLRDNGALLHQLSYQAKWELVILWDREEFEPEEDKHMW